MFPDKFLFLQNKQHQAILPTYVRNLNIRQIKPFRDINSPKLSNRLSVPWGGWWPGPVNKALLPQSWAQTVLEDMAAPRPDADEL